jgi:hypothetical protein
MLSLPVEFTRPRLPLFSNLDVRVAKAATAVARSETVKFLATGQFAGTSGPSP